MEKVIRICISMILLTVVSCKKQSTLSNFDQINKHAIIVKDCTGTYLRIDGKDYGVCNFDKVSSYTDGTSVTVSYKFLKNCSNFPSNNVDCNILHGIEGWIEVKNLHK